MSVKVCAWSNDAAKAYMRSQMEGLIFAFPNLDIIAIDIKVDTAEKTNSPVAFKKTQSLT